VSTRRYGATLNGLLSAIDSFARGVEAARNANDALARKLESVQELVHSTERASEARQGDLERRVLELEQKLRSQRKTFEQERRFLTEEQDEFLRALLEEHEEQLAALRRERDAALQGRGGHGSDDGAAEEGGDSIAALRREVATLRAERESSRSLVERMRAQRDQAQAALRRAESRADGAHPTTPAPPPFVASVSLHVPPAPRAPTELALGLPSSGAASAPDGSVPGKRDKAG
jgi:chromosome segregation ATPase